MDDWGCPCFTDNKSTLRGPASSHKIGDTQLKGKGCAVLIGGSPEKLACAVSYDTELGHWEHEKDDYARRLQGRSSYMMQEVSVMLLEALVVEWLNDCHPPRSALLGAADP